MQDGVQDGRQRIVKFNKKRKMIDFSSIFFCNTPFQIVSWSVKLYRPPPAILKTYLTLLSQEAF